MSEDSLRDTWMAGQPMDRAAIEKAIDAALEETRAEDARGRWQRRLAMLTFIALCPVLLWCAAFGIAPLVRAGYALMAVGTAMMVFAEWMYFTWSRQALPGPVDVRSHLQKAAFLLSRQAHLLRTAPLWCAPIFVGTALIGTWAYHERTHAAGFVLWACVLTAWMMSWRAGHSRVAKLLDRRARLDQLLSDLG
jgi:hypothetical protein